MNREAMEDVIKGSYKVIDNNPTYRRLISGNGRPTVEDGEDLLDLLSVVHDELRLCVSAIEKPL